jgi:hypothetical protein
MGRQVPDRRIMRRSGLACSYSCIDAEVTLDAVDQVIQILGALLILGAFAAAQFGWLDLNSRRYLVANLVGAMILTVLAVEEHQWGFVLLEGVWSLVSAWALVQVLRGRTPPATGH